MIATFLARANSPLPLVFWSVIGFIAGMVLFVYGFRLLQRRRLILDTPFSKIRSACMGLVEVSGQAIGPYTLIAPITACACYYYRTVVYELQQRGKNTQWVKVAGECMFVPFFLDDNTGRVMVDPRGAELDLYHDFEREFSSSFFTSLDPAPGNVTAFLARRGVSTHRKLKVEEFCIKPKNALFVLGTLGDNPGIEVAAKPIEDTHTFSGNSAFSFPLSLNISFSSSSAENDIDQGALVQYIAKTSSPSNGQQVIRLSHEAGPVNTAEMTQQQKVAAALMKAGISNPLAWGAAGLATPQVQVITDSSAESNSGNGNGANSAHSSDGESQNGQRSNTQSSSSAGVVAPPAGFVLRPPVVLKKGNNDKSFLISWRSQQEVARSLGWKCTLMIWGGPILALLSLYIFLSVEHLI